MIDTAITLKERHARKMARMDQALGGIDASLLAYARRHGGRCIRYGATAAGRMRRHNDWPDRPSPLRKTSASRRRCWPT